MKPGALVGNDVTLDGFIRCFATRRRESNAIAENPLTLINVPGSALSGCLA
jgi:hypothetical protein